MQNKKTMNGHIGCTVGEDWPDFERQIRNGMDTIDNVSESMTRLERHLEDLQHLKKLNEISARLQNINDSLIGPATSLERVPFRALWLQFILFFGTMLITAALLIVDRIKDTNTSVDVNSKGLKIETEK